MKIKRNSYYVVLAIIICVGAILRFLQLELKPLWLDEILTALFSLGKSYQDIPINIVFTPLGLNKLFSLNPDANCNLISQNLINQSTHPPLYFCLNNWWLTLFKNSNYSLIWQLRAFPAIIGLLTIVAIYYLNRLAFSAEIGLMSAAIMAVSPFGVYLSQEARHYTLPILLITLSLIALIKIQKELEQQKVILKTWIIWIVINAISFYVHYFSFISYAAQIGTILVLVYKFKIKKYWQIFIYILLPIVLFTPWLSILTKHSTSSKTDWLPTPEHITPLLQIIVSWILMIISLPVENQSLIIQIFCGLIMIAFSGWIFTQIYKYPFKKNNSIFTLLSFICFVLLQFLMIIYILRKDITVAPRYNFIYYPAVVSLLAVTLPRKTHNILILVGIISSIFVVNNLAFQKPYQPEIVAHNFNSSSAPLMIVLAYESSNELALELSFLAELNRIRSQEKQTIFYLVSRHQTYEEIFPQLSKLSIPFNPENLWIFAPQLRQPNYPEIIKLSKENQCLINKKEYYKVNSPYFYQLYRCTSS